MKDMKEIILICDPPFFNSVDVQVCDFPSGYDEELYRAREIKWRRRCKVTVEFAKVDVEQLKKQGKNFDEAMQYYKDWLYAVVKRHLASDWKCVDGYEPLMEIIEDKVRLYYEEK